MYRVLVVDDDKVLQQSVKTALEYHHFVVDCANNGKEAVSSVHREKYDLVVMDVNMPEMNGIDALVEIKRFDPSMIVLILTAYSNVTDAVRAVKEGAFNYLEKPIVSDNLVALIKRALKARSLVETTAFSAPILSLGDKSNEDKFVGESGEMQKVFNVITKLAKVNTPVLIRGETGTGKELVAKAIHFNGPRKDEKFISINCAAIPENLIESELFGHEKGAFTGADTRKIGRFQYADGGTLFLDEIGDVSPTLQVKLLRVLQEKSFTPVGANREVKVDVRIIAASHKPFEQMIKDGSFREDLFFRLNVLPVYLPPLRERKSDIPHLILYYINYFNNLHNLNIKSCSAEVQEALVNYAWPGNIRELRNVIEHCFIIESGDEIQFGSLPESIKRWLANKANRPGPGANGQGAQAVEEDISSRDDHDVEDDEMFEDEQGPIINIKDIQNSVLDENPGHTQPAELPGFVFQFGQGDVGQAVKLDFQMAKDQFEKQFIIQALKMNRGKINQTALKANIPKKTLLRKIEKYEINPKSYYSV